MEALQGIDNKETPTKKGRGQYERKARGGYKKHKLEKKVTVKFYLNKRVNFNKMIDKSEENYPFTPWYPVYVQITFNRKMTNIRSATEALCSNDEEFKEMLEEEETKNLFERERKFIEFNLTDYYNHYLAITKKNLGNTAEEDIELFTENSFDLKDALLGFSYADFAFNKEIDRGLKFELKNFAVELALNEIREQTGREELNEDERAEFNNYYHAIQYSIEAPDCNISALELLNFFEMRKPVFQQMRVRFPSEIWHFNIFYGLLRSSGTTPYAELDATILDYTEGDLKAFFLSYFIHTKEKIDKIFIDIDLLIKNGTF
ncbi:hypothetical protein [Emticicia sp.]|uniref:hypothetical protein n=1 Tax=Emticicia sp. TaxID=1930953 RepID=UPI003750E765